MPKPGAHEGLLAYRRELDDWVAQGATPEGFEKHLLHRVETEPEVGRMARAAVVEEAVEAFLDEQIEAAIKAVRAPDGSYRPADIVAEIKRRDGFVMNDIDCQIVSYQRRHRRRRSRHRPPAARAQAEPRARREKE